LCAMLSMIPIKIVRPALWKTTRPLLQGASWVEDRA
jgi:hypothetical protein